MNYSTLHKRLLKLKKNPEVYQPYVDQFIAFDKMIKTMIKRKENVSLMLKQYKRALDSFEDKFVPISPLSCPK